MFNINIEKKVKSINKKELRQYSDIASTENIKGLIGFADQQDSQLLRTLSPNCGNLEVERKMGNKIQLENLNKEFDGKALSYIQIKKLAINYKLRFLPSNLFIGAFSGKALQALKDFAKEGNIELNQHTLTSNFYILAPQNLFQLKEGVKRSPLISIKLDPSLFYKDNLTDTFVHIKSWGKDFTILRRIKGLIWSRHRNYFAFWSMISCFVLNLFTSYFYNFGVFYPERNLFVTILLSLLIGLIAMNIKDGYFSCQIWNSKMRNEDREYKFSNA